MKYLLILTLSLFVINNNKALSNVLPNDIFSAIEVVELQMTSLQTNSKINNEGIYQCWLFAHPENKKYTGPFSNFKRMIANTSYKILLNSIKFKTQLISKSDKVIKYSVVIDAFDNKRYQLDWILEKAKLNKDCKNCWMTTVVTQPQFIGQLN
ncbi:MAG: hypothetical protein P8N41_06215 [Alphaproteobacteria bacterium]|nr:hypothetical protein [Alphaproteobacteria bacterium]MDG2458518.1 hypothetical protein [Alphaproteobacteria bacterium]|tara:strand:- start:73 stop:531 length:459 start_codon:yes stop_codon:yes gene_type:complete